MPGESYMVGGDAERRNVDVVTTICDILDQVRPRPGGGSHRDQIEFVQDRPGHDFRYAIDSSKLQRELGWKRLESFETGIERTVRWYIDNRDWWEPIRDGSYQGDRLGLHVAGS